MTFDEQIALLQGVKECRTLQYTTDGKLWQDLVLKTGAAIYFDPNRVYRLKPEPRRFWIVTNLDGSRLVFDSQVIINNDETIIPVVEVLP